MMNIGRWRRASNLIEVLNDAEQCAELVRMDGIEKRRLVADDPTEATAEEIVEGLRALRERAATIVLKEAKA